MLSYIDETRVSRNFNVKVRSFPCVKTDDMFYYLVPLLEKFQIMSFCMLVLNDAIEHQSNDIISKIFKLKEFIQLKVPNCKVITSTPIKRHNNKKASSVVDDVIQQLQQSAVKYRNDHQCKHRENHVG